VPTNKILVRTVLVPTNEILFSVRTVLVPTNEVFEKLPASVRDSLKEDKNKTAEVQHILSICFLTAHLKNCVPFLICSQRKLCTALHCIVFNTKTFNVNNIFFTLSFDYNRPC
jgi:hypothetical protein